MAWLTGWGYRKSHVINYVAGAGTNYPIRIKVNIIQKWSKVSDNAIHEWFQNKYAAVRYQGTYNRTYFGFIDNAGNVKIKYFDHDAKTFSGEVTIKAFGSTDDHGSPSLLILPNGRILAFYALHDSPQYCRITTNPEDITSWEPEVTVDSGTGGAGGSSYPQPIRTSDGKIWVFYRKRVASDQYVFVYRTSTNNGATWSDYTTIADFGNQWWAYGWVCKGTDDSIHVMLNPYSSVLGVLRKIGYMWTEDGTNWKKRDGTAITLPASQTTMDVVYDYGSDAIYVWGYDFKLDSDNQPFITFVTDVANAGKQQNGRWAKWNGTAWVNYFVAYTYCFQSGAGLAYPSGLVIDPTNVFRCYVAAKVPNEDRSEIQIWKSSDEGVTWNKTEDITENSPYSQVRPQIVANGTDILVWWVNVIRYVSFLDFNSTMQCYPNVSQNTGENCYVLSAKVRNDFGDIRFTGSDGVTLLDYWMEEKVDGEYAVFWVKIADDLSTNPVTIYVYYGKADATTTSNGTATFIWFDNFETYEEDSDLNGQGLWTKTTTFDTGEYLTADTLAGSKRMHLHTASSSSNNYFRGTLPSAQAFPFRVQFLVRTNDVTASFFYLIAFYNGDTAFLYLIFNNGYLQYYNGYSYNNIMAVTANTWYKLRLDAASNTNITLYVDEVNKGQVDFDVSTSQITSFVAGGYKTWITCDAYWDDWFLSKYVSPEPSHGSWGSEKTTGAWHQAETWNTTTYTLKWFSVEIWQITVYTLKWFLSEVWSLINIYGNVSSYGIYTTDIFPVLLFCGFIIFIFAFLLIRKRGHKNV